MIAPHSSESSPACVKLDCVGDEIGDEVEEIVVGRLESRLKVKFGAMIWMKVEDA